MKKIISIMLSVLLVIGLLAVCGCGESEVTSSSDNASTNAVLISKDDVKYVNNSESVYNIIRPVENTELGETTSATIIFKKYKEVLNVNAMNRSDEDDGTDKYEILVGATNRPESQQALDYIESKGHGRYQDWIICTIGKKIVINAYTAEGLQEAANYFADNFLKAEGVKGGIEQVNITKGDFMNILVNNVSICDFKIVRPHFNFSYLAQVELEKVYESIMAKTGFQVDVVHDNTEASEYEIIVGNAARDGVEKLTDYDAYSIKVSGKKIYINGGSIHSTALAVSEFSKMLASGNLADANSATGSYAQTIKSYGNDTLKYVWGDDFDGDKLDTSKWYQNTGTEYSPDGQHGKLTLSNDDPNYVFVKDSKFHICATYDDNYWYGGMIRTTGIMMYKYGYTEISAIVPHGPGFWCAFWASKKPENPPVSNTDPSISMWLRPEVDIMEMFGNSASYRANAHRWPTSVGKQMGYAHTSLDGSHGNLKKYTHPDEGGRLSDGYHTYGLLWDDTKLAFTCDGEIFFEYDTTTKPEDIEPFNHEMYLILNLHVGSASRNEDILTTTDEEWKNSNKFIIEYCNLYQKNDGKSYINHLK